MVGSFVFRIVSSPWKFFWRLSLFLLLLVGGIGFVRCPSPKPSEVRVGLSALREPVEVILDELGIAHVFARNEWDLRVAEGYFHARDRFVQMDLYRRTARGRLAELVGPDGIDSDAAMRTFGLGRAAEATVAEIASRAAGGDGEAADLLASMEAFAAGVNAYIAEITTGRVPPPALYTALLGRNPTSEEIPSWEPVDSFAIGKLESFDQSFSAYYDLIGEDHREKMLATFGEPGAPGVVPGREGFFWDMFRLEPAVEVSILPPAGGGRRHPLRKSSALGGKRSPTPDPLIEAAIERIEQAFRPLPLLDRTPLGSGSNNWVVSGRHTASGFPILANDTHMGLPVPTIFYQIHLNTAAQGGELDMAGVTIPGVPGILIGHTAYLAWGITNALVDVTDVYRERVVERDGEMAVLFDDPFDDPDEGTKEVPVRVIDRPIRVRDPETKELFEVPFTVKEVPHHGPILSEGGGEAISFRWSGLGATGESFTFPRLHRARTVEEAREAMRPYDVPPFSFVFADIEGRIAYSGQAYLPIRSEAARSPETPPFFPLPGGGDHEWIGRLDPDDAPFLLDPEEGFIVTANNAIAGHVFDNDPLNDGHYFGAFFAPGFRAARIRHLLEEKISAGEPLTIEAMVAIQADMHSNTAERLLPHLLEAAAEHPESIPEGTGVEEALSRLAAWDLQTPAAISPNEPQIESRDPAVRASSVATTIYNLWQNAFLTESLDDEDAAIRATAGEVRFLPDLHVGFNAILKNLEAPEETFTGWALFDRLDTPQIETPAQIMLESLARAVEKGEEIFGTPEMDEWLWGRLHTITFQDLTGIPANNIPPGDLEDEAGFPTGFPRKGDRYSIDACDFSFRAGMGSAPESRNDFTYGGGPSIRFVVEMIPGAIRAVNVIPGGQSGHRASPHYADQAHLWVENEAHPLHFYLTDILEHEETRFLLLPEP